MSIGCVLVTAQIADEILPVHTHKIRPLVLKPGKWPNPLPPEKKNVEGLPRAPECADRARTSINVSGRASRVDRSAFRQKKCSYKRDIFEKVRIFT